MATYVKANNLTNLDVSGSWSPAGVPTAGDLAQFTNTFNTAGTLSTTGSLTVGKLQVTNTARNISLSPTGTLTLNADYASDAGVAIEVASTYAFLLTLTSNINIPTSATIKTGNLNLNISGSGSKTFDLSGDLTIATAGGVSPTMRFTGWDKLNISGSLIVNSGVTIRLEGSDVDRVTVNGTAEIYNIVDLDVLAGSGTIQTNVGSGGTLTFNSFGTFSGSLVTGPFGNTVTVGKDDSSSSFGGVISGAGALVKYGTGTLTLSGNNTYYGSTYVGEIVAGAGAGTIDVRNNNALGTAALEVNKVFMLKNGVAATSVTISNTININEDLILSETGAGLLTLSGTINFDGVHGIRTEGAFQTISGTLSGSTPRFESGLGFVTLSGTNTTGSFTLAGGYVRLSGASVLGTPGDTVNFNGGGGVGNDSSTPLTLSSYYYYAFTGFDFFGAGPLSLGPGTFGIYSSPNIVAYEFEYTIPGVVYRPSVPGNTGRLSIGLSLFGPPGKVYLSNTANTFSGGVELLGTLKISGSNSLGAYPGSFDNDNVLFSGGVLECDSNITFGANRGFYLDSGGGAINGTAGFSIGGVMSGPGSILINNTGTNNLSGVNSHTGGTIFLLGDTHLSAHNTVGSGDIFLSGGTLYCDSPSTSKLTSSGTIKFTGGTLVI